MSLVSNFDIGLVDTGDGGDFLIESNDLSVIDFIENQTYLALFGGNIEASTENKRITGTISKDYWGNNLLMFANKPIQYNSATEEALITTPLTSAGRTKIITAIKQDLQFLVELGIVVNIDAKIVATDRIEILIETIYQERKNIKILTYTKRLSDGDFSYEDFNDDFY